MLYRFGLKILNPKLISPSLPNVRYMEFFAYRLVLGLFLILLGWKKYLFARMVLAS